MIISPLVSGFYSVVNPKVLSFKDNLHIINEFQFKILTQALKGDFVPSGENETIAFQNLTNRGMFSEKTSNLGKYSKNLSIWVHTTNQCPLRCVYCHVEKRDEHMQEHILQSFGDMLVRTAKAKGLKRIKLRLAGGEPVLRFRHMKKWLDDTKVRLEKIGCEFRIGILSGFSILPDDVIDFVEQGNGISVSMDGLDDVQNTLRPLVNGKGSFENVTKNIYKLQERGINPYVLTVISDGNLDGLLPFTKWLLSKNLGFRYSFQKGGELNRKKVQTVLQECYQAIEEAVLSGAYTRFNSHRLADIATFKAKQTACGAGRSSCSVYLDGSIYMCQMEHENKAPLGNVSEMERDLCEILVDRQERRHFHNISTDCNDCQIKEHCAGGCPIDTKEAHGHNSNCELFKEFLPRIHRIHGLKKLQMLIGKEKFQKLMNKPF